MCITQVHKKWKNVTLSKYLVKTAVTVYRCASLRRNEIKDSSSCFELI